MPITTNEEVLEPIPMNFVDMARDFVMKKSSAGHGDRPPSERSEPAPTRCEQSACEERTPRQAPVDQNATCRAKYFHDASGNEYKMVGDDLFRKGWKPLAMKARLVKTSTGKTLSMEDKEIQVYGWIRMAGSEDDVELDTKDEEDADAEACDTENGE